MRILIAPTSFKGTLSAQDAARAIEDGVRRGAARRGIEVEVDVCPIGDGGEGSAALLGLSVGATRRTATVTGPLDGAPIEAEWFHIDAPEPRTPLAAALELEDAPGALAIFDSAQVVGLPRIPEERRDPTRVSTRGIGELIEAARADGCATVVIGLGGTASVDGGIGAASALGWTFLDGSGAALEPIGASLGGIARVVAPASVPDRPAVVALADVSNPLIGPDGAARTFGPQKGATPEQVEALERGLVNLTTRCIASAIPVNPGAEGAGAAGGLGFGLLAFADARVSSGAPTILRALNAELRLAEADLVITGEGSLDAQTTHGKAIAAIAGAARRAGVPIAAIAGRATPESAEALGLMALATLVNDETTPERAQSEAATLVADRAAELLSSLELG